MCVFCPGVKTWYGLLSSMPSQNQSRFPRYQQTAHLTAGSWTLKMMGSSSMSSMSMCSPLFGASCRLRALKFEAFSWLKSTRIWLLWIITQKVLLLEVCGFQVLVLICGHNLVTIGALSAAVLILLTHVQSILDNVCHWWRQKMVVVYSTLGFRRWCEFWHRASSRPSQLHSCQGCRPGFERYQCSIPTPTPRQLRLVCEPVKVAETASQPRGLTVSPILSRGSMEN